MKNYFSPCFFLFLFAGIMGCETEVPKAVEPVAEVKMQPEDTLDLLAEKFLVNAESDTLVPDNEPLQGETKTSKKVEHQPVKVSKPKEKIEKIRSRKKPEVSFETETHSFGRIMQGVEKEFKFKFKNTGKADLQIINVTATCGCTTPSYPFIPISPGEEGFIGVTYNSTGKLGAQKPAITVITNASPKTYKLYLEGIVDTERED